MLSNQPLSDTMTQSISKAVSAQITQPKNYFVFGYDTDGKLIPMRQQGFDDLTSALHYLATVSPNWTPFVTVRLTNV
jgi:hypothetical protein